jgi:hypothetical protein
MNTRKRREKNRRNRRRKLIGRLKGMLRDRITRFGGVKIFTYRKTFKL